MSYTIRVATVDDLPVLRAMWIAMMTEMGQPYPAGLLSAETLERMTAAFARALTTEADTVCLLAENIVGEPIGFHLFGYETRALGEPQRYLWIYWIYCVPAVRNSPIVEDLAQLAAEHAQARGVTMAEMSRLPGRALRRGLGFEPVEIRCAAPVETVLVRLARRRQRRTAQGLRAAARREEVSV